MLLLKLPKLMICTTFVCVINCGNCEVIEVYGHMQYAPKDKLLDANSLDLLNGRLSRKRLQQFFSPIKNVDVDIVLYKLSGRGKEKRVLNLKTASRLSLSQGEYRFECSRYDLALAESHGDQGWCIRADAIIQIASDSVVGDGNKVRQICIMCYEKGSRVAVCGRVVNSRGRPVGNVRVVGEPLTLCNRDYHKSVYKKTDENGVFEFVNQPPASLDIATYYLLTGERTSSLIESGDKVMDFRVVAGEGNNVAVATIPLLSESNFPLLRDLTEQIKKSLPDNVIKLLQHKKVGAHLFPVSTNNVIYVGDIVLPDKKQQSKD